MCSLAYEQASSQAPPEIPHGLVVRIPAFHVGGPGSIPGMGTLFYDARSLKFGYKTLFG